MANGVLKARVGGAWVAVQNAGNGSGSVNGPVTSLAGRVAIWNDTVGTTLADSGIVATQLVLTADARLTDARAPTVHASTHKAGGTDVLKLDDFAAPTDITTLNATTTAHGLLPKLPGGTTAFLRGDGTWVVPAGTPSAHATTHAAAGADPVVVTTLAGYPATTTTFLRGDGTFASQLTGGLILAGPLVFTGTNFIAPNTLDGADSSYLQLAGGGTAGSTRGAWIQLGGNEYNVGLMQLFPGGVNGARIDLYRIDGGTTMASWDGATGASLFTTTQVQGWGFSSTHAIGGYVAVQKSGTNVALIGAASAMGIGAGSSLDGCVKASAGGASLFLESGNAIKSVTLYTDVTASAPNVYVQFDGRLQRSTSSLKYKTAVEPLTEWDWLLQITPITFREAKHPDGRAFAGLAAEEVARLAPMFAIYNAQGEPEEVAYGHLVAPLIRALHNHEARLRSLEL